MVKIFLDVGGYHGESSMAALDPRFGFDRVYCFEPVRSCYDEIVRAVGSNPRLVAINAGLLDRTTQLPIYQSGSLGGSIYGDAPKTGGGTEMCEFLDVVQFVQEKIPPGAKIWMKLNCEGAECDIMLRLIESGEAARLTEVLLDLDAQKIPSAQLKLARLQDLLKSVTFSFHYPKEVQYQMVTNYGSIRNWLIVTGAIEKGLAPLIKSIVYQTRFALDPKTNGYYKIRILRALGLRPQPDVPTKPGSALRTIRRL